MFQHYALSSYALICALLSMLSTMPRRSPKVCSRPCFMYGLYYRFDNPRFRKSQNLNDYAGAHVDVYRVSSEHLKCRLFK